MSSPAQAAHKRKRAPVTYYESDTDIDSAYASDDSIDYNPRASRQPKKAKKTTPTKGRATKGSKKPSTFPFLSLPPELRNAIYAYALTDVSGSTKGYNPHVIDEPGLTIVYKIHSYRQVATRAAPGATFNQKGDCMDIDSTQAHKSLSPALLATNRQIHTEASQILYGQTIYAVDNIALHAFLAQIGPTNQKLLRDVVIRFWGTHKAHRTMNFPAMTLLAGVTGLTRLRIDSRLGYYQVYAKDGKPAARLFYRNARYWLEAMARKHGRADAGVNVVALENDGFQPWTEGTDEYEKWMDSFRDELRRLMK